MVKVILCDFSGVILKVKGERPESMNALYRQLSSQGEYSVLDHFEINEELLNFLKSLKDRVGIYMLTNSIIQDESEIKVKLDPVFTKIYSAGKTGLDKGNPQSYIELARELNVKPEEILFIDDSLGNIEAAKASRVITIYYQSNQQLFKEFKQYV